MARKRRSKRQDRGSQSQEGHDEYGITRKLGSFLALVVVSVITVVVGFAIGRYVIVNVIADTLGLDAPAQTASSSGLADSSLGRSTATEVTVETVKPSQVADGSQTISPQAASSAQVQVPAPATSQVSSSGTTPAPSQSASTSSGAQTRAATMSSTPPAANESTAQASPTSGQQATSSGKVLYRVQVGGYTDRASADQLLAALKGTFPDAYVIFSTDFRVQVGAFSTSETANEVAEQLRAQGYTPVHIVPVNL